MSACTTGRVRGRATSAARRADTNRMPQPIGMLIGSIAGPATKWTHAATGVAAPGSSASFADQLDASFRARATRLGLELPQPAHGERSATEPTEDLWARMQREDAAINGVSNAIMRSLADAADARHEQRHRRGRGPFDT